MTKCAKLSKRSLADSSEKGRHRKEQVAGPAGRALRLRATGGARGRGSSLEEPAWEHFSVTWSCSGAEERHAFTAGVECPRE